MSLNTFSAFVDFAIRSESSGLDFFIRSEAKLSGSGREALSRFRAEAEKNVKQLRVVLRENVTELVMEPCAAVDGSAYEVPEALEAGDLGSALGVLLKQRDFLRAAAKCVNLKEVRRTFEKLADAKDRLMLEYKL